MGHQIREGIVLKNICGEWLLIAAGDAAEHCMYVRQVNDSLAYYWSLIEKGCTTEEIMAQAREDYQAPAEIIEKDVKELIELLYDLNYLVKPSGYPEDGM